MNDINDNELFLDAVDAVVLEALAAIGSDPAARLRFFGQLLAVAQEEAGGRCLSQPAPSTRRARATAPVT